MRIAQVAPLYESVPPKLYGGTERIVHNLTEALVGLGHEVTLFASGDSATSGELVPIGPEALRLSGTRECLAPHLLMFETLRRHAHRFDLIHFHTEYMHMPLARGLTVPSVFTLHGRQDLPEYQSFYTEFSETPLVSISLSQRRPLPFANWVGNVYHGLQASHLNLIEKKEDYLAFVGRISPEKGIEHAIEIARRAGTRLKIAAKIEPMDWDYYQSMRPLLEGPGVEFVGEIDERQKCEFMGRAKAVLFPITWPEPFGLVMIEAAACGTPVVAFRNGSVPEVIRDRETGFIVDDVEGAVRALERIETISPAACRRAFDERHSSERMASDYVKIYESLVVRPADHRPAVIDLAFASA